MWTRADLKANAKQALKANGYWIALAVVVIFALLGGGIGGGNLGSGSNVEYRIDQNDIGNLEGLSESLSGAFAPLIIGIGISIILFAIAYMVFVVNPLTAGKSRFFLEHLTRSSTVGTLFWAFRRNGYLNVVRTLILQQVFIFLWSLLLIIPGILKAYQYSMVPYILAENPTLPWRRALEMSRRMTDGSKFDIFVLQLSFIGWFLLGTLALGFGLLFVAPYYEATMAGLYARLRAKALKGGVASREELPGIA